MGTRSRGRHPSPTRSELLAELAEAHLAARGAVGFEQRFGPVLEALMALLRATSGTASLEEQSPRTARILTITRGTAPPRSVDVDRCPRRLVWSHRTATGWLLTTAVYRDPQTRCFSALDLALARIAAPLLRGLGEDAALVELVDRHGLTGPVAPLDLSASPLSPREREVASLLELGHPHKEIARVLDLSLSRVKRCLESIYRKTGASNKTEALRALRDGSWPSPPVQRAVAEWPRCTAR